MPDQLIGKELAAAVAQHIMGWTVIEAKGEDWFDNIPSEAFPIFAMWPAGGTAVYRSQHDISSLEFRPSESIEAAMQVEDRIAELSLQANYIAGLWEVLGDEIGVSFWNKSNFETMWLCIHATPEQRCLAALKAIQEKKQK